MPGMSSDTRPWIPLDRSISPTTAATNLYNALAKTAPHTVNLGQGRETTEFAFANRKIQEHKAKGQEKELDSKYQGPHELLRARAAEWFAGIMGIDAKPDTTFPVSLLGRKVLDTALVVLKSQARHPAKSAVLIPDTSWPMVPDLLRDHGIKGVTYAMERGRYADNILAALEGAQAQKANVVAIYINSPHNPTGQILTRADFEEIFSRLDAINAQRRRQCRPPIAILCDNPYFHACAQAKDTGRLDAGMEPFQKRETPWIVAFSFSKAFGSATPGFSAAVCSDDLKAAVSARMMRESTAISYDKRFYDAMADALQMGHAPLALAHFSNVRKKYIVNRATLETIGLPVVDGDPGMTALVKLHPSEYCGAQVRQHDGSPMTIEDLNDVIEYAANKHGIVAVNNGVDPQTGEWLLRLAAAEKPERYAQGVVNLKAALDELRAARPNPAPPSHGPGNATPENAPRA